MRGKAMFGDPRTIPQDEMPAWLWRLLTPLPIRFHTFLSRGLMPPIIREKMNYSWTATDERRFRAAARVIRAVLPRLPARLRYNPVALAAFERDGWPTR